jgi:hypothetical protein
MVTACAAKKDPPLYGSEHVDAAPLPIDTPCGSMIEFSCDVSVTCDGVVSPKNVTMCSNSDDGPTLEGMARTKAFQCPHGFELEDATVCISDQTYDASTTDVCAHLPASAGACSVACDRTALYAFATTGYHVSFCTSTDGITFQVGAAPMTGDGAR